MRYELEPTQFVLRAYEGSDENYIASATIRVYGDRAWVSQISSPRLFEAMPAYFDQFMSRLGVKSLEGYMSKAMARAVRMACRKWADFKITHEGECAGRTMPWVVLSRKGQ